MIRPAYFQCYGHTGADIDKNKLYSISECDALIDKDMSLAIRKVESCVPGLPEPVLAAFSDAVYNMGPTIACDPKKSTAARYLKAGDLGAACNQLPRWDKSRVMGVMVTLPGLTTRREKEKQLCLSALELP